MRITFTANEARFDDDYAFVCGVAGEGHYLMFQRDLEDSDEDWGIHLEYDDPSNGRHECVVGCRLGSQSLSVELSRPLSQQLAGVSGFDVALQLDPEQWATIRDGLQRVFRGYQDLLVVAELSGE